MNRKGHIGMTLLAFAPLAYYLVSDGKLLLAVVSLGVIHVIEPLPDQDFHIPGLTHRGVSHSLLAVLVVGGILGACGWLLGEHLFDMVDQSLSAGGDLWNSLLSILPTFSAAVLRGLVPSIPAHELVATLERQAGENLRWSLGIFGFGVGAYGIVAHLLGDVITMRGVKPFLPISHWRLSLSSLRADNPMANSALLGLGVVAIVVVVVATVPGVLLGTSAPATLSPVGVAAGENTTTSAPMTTSTTQAPITTTNTTQNASATNVSNATVTLSNQTTNGSTVTVERATLPDGGFVVLSNDPYREVGSLTESMIAVSKPLSPDTHRNISIAVNNSPPGGVVNQTTLNTTSDYSVGLYRDTNNNSRFEYISSAGTNDTAYLVGSGTKRRFASDAAIVAVPGSNTSTPNASIRFQDQPTTDSAVTVQSVTLPDGGFVVVHSQNYLHGGDPLATILGRSRYLSAGTHRNVSVRLNGSGSLQRGQTLVAVPSQDTNDNQTYDYVRSDGFQDVPYTANNAAVTGKASVTGADSSSSSGAGPGSSTASPATRTTGHDTSSHPSSATPKAGRSASEAEGGVRGWIASNPLPTGIGVVVIVGVVVLPTIVRRFGQ